jgi:hypothetical protein
MGPIEADIDVDPTRSRGHAVVHKVGDGGHEFIADVPQRLGESTGGGCYIDDSAY